MVRWAPGLLAHGRPPDAHPHLPNCPVCPPRCASATLLRRRPQPHLQWRQSLESGVGAAPPTMWASELATRRSMKTARSTLVLTRPGRSRGRDRSLWDLPLTSTATVWDRSPRQLASLAEKDPAPGRCADRVLRR